MLLNHQIRLLTAVAQLAEKGKLEVALKEFESHINHIHLTWGDNKKIKSQKRKGKRPLNEKDF